MVNSDTQDPLARWWWPGQWLHIVYGIWVDQLWCWQNVWPKLSDRRQVWSIFLQSWLGSVIVTLLLLGVTLGIMGTNLGKVRWQAWVGLVAYTVIILGFSIAETIKGRVEKGVSIGPTLLPLFVTIRFVQDQYLITGLSGKWISFLVLCVGLGFAYGILAVVSQRNTAPINILPVVIALIISMPSISLGALKEYRGIVGLVLVVAEVAAAVWLGGFSVGLGGRWGARHLNPKIGNGN